MKKKEALSLRSVLSSQQFALSLVLIAIATLLNAAGSVFIQANFPDRPMVPDLLFELLPYIPGTQDMTDILNVLGVTLVFGYFVAVDRIRIPYAVSAFAITEILRAFMIVLTPIGGPLGNVVNYGLTSIHQHGQIPSGHTLVVALGYMLVDGKKAPLLKLVLFLAVIGEVVCLLLSHGHYSIDIVAGLLIAYFGFHELERYKDRRWFLPGRSS
jgi:membrane-associated phospholipid phosphatase